MARLTLTALSIMLLGSAAAVAQQAPAAEAAAAQSPAAGLSEEQRISYALGMAQARSLQKLGGKVDPRLASQGFSDLMSGRPRITDAEARAVLAKVQKEEAAKVAAAGTPDAQRTPAGRKQAATQMQAAQKAAAARNKAAGQAFLEANKAKPGVITLASGLQYRVIRAGFGAKPTPDATVLVNYSGKSLDGNEFGSTYKAGQPLSVPIKKMIPGWREALPMMQAGSKWEVVVPPELAYGERTPSRNIAPNSTLIFELELVSVAGHDPADANDKPKP